MEKKRISWITFNAFIDTDLYAVKELTRYYKIDWFIIRSENDRFEYLDDITEMQKLDDLKIQLCICGKRLRKIGCISYYLKMINLIKKDKPNLVFSSMAGAPYFIPVLSLLLKPQNVIMAIHNVHIPKGGTAYNFFKLYNKMTISLFMNFMTYSMSQMDALKKLVPHKNVFYVPFMMKEYGVSKKKRESNIITFLNFGNIREYKRIDVLIDAAQMAYEETGIIFKVIIAGKCDNWYEYQKLIKYEFLFDIRIGRVENNDIADLFNECDYFVAPYQDIAQSGSSVVALNYGKPIIASKLPAFEEYIEDCKTGYLIKPADKENLKDVMVAILQSGNLGYDKMVDDLVVSRDALFSTNAIVARYRGCFDYVIEKYN